MATTISELQDMMKDHLRGQQEDRLRLQEERQGLFIIKATGDSAAIANNAAFQPKVF